MPRSLDPTSGRQSGPYERLKHSLTTPAAPGFLLIFCTLLALVVANSPLAESYHDLLESPISVGLGSHVLSYSFHHWVNDGLMAIFFFAIGLEIKREFLIGELSSAKKATLPILAASGGMLVPGLIYLGLNAGGAGAHGWAIPTATDIAFAIGILALLGNRVPLGLKVFLTALAIVDDLGAVIVIAAFYTNTISLPALGVAGVGLLIAIMLNRLHVRTPFWYALVGITVWLAMLKSGVHATIAGVLMGLTIPVRTFYDGPTWLERIEMALARYRKLLNEDIVESDEELGIRQEAVHAIEVATERAQSPLVRLEHALAPWVSFLIIPIFAFTNAGVVISTESFASATASSVSWGIFLGLFLGKQIGVFVVSWMSIKLKIAVLPDGVGWKQLYGVSILAGVGFTMSLFITELSFEHGSSVVDLSKIAILSASLVSGVVGYLVLRRLARNR